MFYELSAIKRSAVLVYTIQLGHSMSIFFLDLVSFFSSYIESVNSLIFLDFFFFLFSYTSSLPFSAPMHKRGHPELAAQDCFQMPFEDFHGGDS